MINIFGLEISPYAICFLMSFVVSFIIISFLLKKSGMPGNIIIYSLMLSVVLSFFKGWGADPNTYFATTLLQSSDSMNGLFTFI